ncbi:nucleoside-diphosphate sugar epimerase [Lysinibacillus sp. SGAir0095]|uniref:nucleoside-diphosphate sugar epimerase n=1 Tax=Lysinibacillus sp. SGAir0095 TaxID=2070463 RepID=UPI0010CCCF45|nr:nucleoside-diphosphate sugar epimerase [Lysinibacillus sp. SGAir0095]QCR33098.1 nucleoside-diphosphate sugar epimerase [Lysinibacillus sp. SGAir0095]
MGKKKVIKKLIDHALADLYLVEKEFHQIVKQTSNKSGTFKWVELLSDYELEELYGRRKDRKYASLTVELYALIEQLLKDIYKVIFDGKYRNTSDVNVILDLEEKMSDFLNFKNNTKILADLRSFIVHEDFSLKTARKNERIKITKKNRILFKQLLKDVEIYIENIKIK